MCKKLIVFRSSDENENRSLRTALNKLDGIEIEYVRESVLLEDCISLPFIETEEGACFFGIDSINAFVEQTMRQRNSNPSDAL